MRLVHFITADRYRLILLKELETPDILHVLFKFYCGFETMLVEYLLLSGTPNLKTVVDDVPYQIS